MLTHIVQRLLAGRTADYPRMLIDARSALAETIDVMELSDICIHAIRQAVRCRKVVILLWNEERLEFSPCASFGAGQFDISVPTGHPMIARVRRVGQALTADTVKNSRLLHTFSWLGIEAVVPMFFHRELTGLVLVGREDVLHPWRPAEVKFFDELASLAAPAFEHARLYREERESNVRLRRDLEEATNELSQANIQLKNLDQAKSEFLSIASHQLYTPLTALRGYISMLKEGDFGAVAEKQQSVLDIVEKSAMRLINLIRNLLDVSRIESGKLELNLEPVNVIDLTRELMVDMAPNAIAKKLTLAFHEPATIPAFVTADREWIRQVMLNFVDNAIKYTTLGRVDVYVYQRGNQVVFSVKDTGKGIRSEDIARLFSKFMRVGGSSRFHTEGTGLGLYVARQIVREHHGEIQVDSAGEGQGSTFSLQLPVVKT